jgi:hypothetical protein
MRSAPLGCALLVSLVGTATALSAVRFTGRDGSVKLISYDGNKLNVPGYCEATTCTTNARGIGANEKAIEALEAAVLATTDSLHATATQNRYERITADEAIRKALVAEETARAADDAVLRNAVISSTEAGAAETKLLKADIAAANAQSARLAEEEKAARMARDAELEAKNEALLDTLNKLIAKVAELETTSSTEINALKDSDSAVAAELAALKDTSESTDKTLATDLATLDSTVALDKAALAELAADSEAADATLESAIKVVNDRHLDDIKALKLKDENLVNSGTTNEEAISALDVASRKADDALEQSLAEVRSQQIADVAALKAEDDKLAAASAQRDDSLGEGRAGRARRAGRAGRAGRARRAGVPGRDGRGRADSAAADAFAADPRADAPSVGALARHGWRELQGSLPQGRPRRRHVLHQVGAVVQPRLRHGTYGRLQGRLRGHRRRKQLCRHGFLQPPSTGGQGHFRRGYVPQARPRRVGHSAACAP